MIGFGLDLAGYTTGRTGFCAIETAGRNAQLTIFDTSVFSGKRKNSDLVHEIVRAEANVVGHCLSLGNVAVDVPIDLEELPRPTRSVHLWQLTQRPVDRALSAMPPLADRIGSVVARFQAVMRVGQFNNALGRSLFETYPQATWQRLKIVSKGYKGSIGHDIIASICSSLKLVGGISNDHELDAAICAIAAVAPEDCLCSEDDYREIASTKARLGSVPLTMPRGFRLLKSNPFESIVLIRKPYADWIPVTA